MIVFLFVIPIAVTIMILETKVVRVASLGYLILRSFAITLQSVYFVDNDTFYVIVIIVLALVIHRKFTDLSIYCLKCIQTAPL